MARNKEPKPRPKRHSLAYVLASYIGKSSASYDPVFDRKIRKLAPYWFITTAIINKEKLIEMAKKGGARPSKKTSSLATVFANYINKIHGSYDPQFAAKVRKLAPHWFKKSISGVKKP